MMSANLDLLPGAPAPLTSKGIPAPRAHDRRVRPDEDEGRDKAAAASGSASPDSPAASTLEAAASPDAPAVPDVAAMPDGDGGSIDALPAAASAGGERHDDRSSVLLAAGLGLLGIGGAAGLAGSSSAGDSKPIATIDSPKSDQPKSDPPVSEQKPDSGTSTPGTDQPSADHPPADQSHPGQPQQPDPGKSNPDPSQPADPAQQPPAHVPVAPTLSLAADTGRSAQDHITSSGAVNVSGLEPGATLAVSLDDGKTWTSHSGDAQLPDALFGADGVKHLEVRQIDAHGNAGEVAELAFTLDRTAPDALHWSMPTDKAALGVADTIAVQGVETDALVQYRPDAQTPWLTAAGSLIPVSMFQHDGVGQIEVRQIDVAGNASDPTTLAASVDVSAPAVPTLSLDVDAGLDPHDRVTSVGVVNVDGPEPSATLSISLDGGQTWIPRGHDTQLPEALFGTDGMKQLLVRQVDASGNESDAASLSFQLDRTAPGALQWTMPDGRTALGLHDVIQVQGAEADARVQYRLDPAAQWSTADGGQIPVSMFQQDGTEHIQVRQVDLAGNAGPSQVVDATVDVTPPYPPAISLPSDDGLPSMWTATRTRSGDITVVIGQSTWQYQWDGGAWQTASGVIPGSQLPGEGLHTLSILQRDAAGNETLTQRQFTIDDTAPVGPRPELINDNGASASDRISGDMTLRVVGLEPDASWLFSNGRNHIAYAGSGDTIPMSALGLDPSGGRQLSHVGVQQQDQAGNRSPMVYVDFTYDPSLGTGVFHV